MTSELEANAQWWYNLATGEVEQGMISQSYDRVGPFDSRADAERALERLAENSRKWDEDEAAD
ncbi:MAG: SPOR domain-containing protein [Agromyces sp.]